MFKLRSRRGSNLIDVTITIFLVCITGAVFSATIPFGLTSSRQAQEYKTAAAIAQRKMEQVRARNFESLTPGLLLASDIIDATPTTSPYSFTYLDAVNTTLPEGTGTLEVTNEAGSTTVKKITVTVSWKDSTTGKARDIVLTTLISDKRSR